MKFAILEAGARDFLFAALPNISSSDLICVIIVLGWFSFLLGFSSSIFCHHSMVFTAVFFPWGRWASSL